MDFMHGIVLLQHQIMTRAERSGRRRPGGPGDEALDLIRRAEAAHCPGPGPARSPRLGAALRRLRAGLPAAERA